MCERAQPVVPFEFFANKIYLQVMVNGHGPYALAFDTGSPTPVFDSDLAKQLDIKPGMPITLRRRLVTWLLQGLTTGR